jgi:hypothetical protein
MYMEMMLGKSRYFSQQRKDTLMRLKDCIQLKSIKADIKKKTGTTT